MSSLEKAAESLDAARAKRLMIQDADFENYMAERDGEHTHIKPAGEYTTQLIEYFNSDPTLHGASLPWIKTQDDIRFRDGEVTLWYGINGHGKSLILGQCMLHWMKEQKVCSASFEMQPVKSLARMCRQALGSNKPTDDFVQRFCNRAADKLWFYDQQGTVKKDRVIAACYYAAEKLGVKHFIIDSLMKCGISEEDMAGQSRFVDELCAAAKDTNCHIHLVHHPRKGVDEHSPPNKMDAKGSGGITDQVDNTLVVWRNKQKEHLIRDNRAGDDDLSAPDAMLICDKQRNGEWEGKVSLWFDPSSLLYRERA
jgi:twinkle protein